MKIYRIAQTHSSKWDKDNQQWDGKELPNPLANWYEKGQEKGRAISEPMFYHVTLTSNIPSILENGLRPNVPGDMSDNLAVYMFHNLSDVHSALSSWLGERFEEEYGEDIDLAILGIDPSGIEGMVFDPEVGFEIMTPQQIPPKNIKVLETGQ